MRKQKKRYTFLSLLGATALLWSCSAGSASAEIDGYVVKSKSKETKDKYFYYDVHNLVMAEIDFLINPKSDGGWLWTEFTKNSEIVALHDSKRGYVDYKDVLSAYSTKRNLNDYTENSAKLYTSLPATIQEIMSISSGGIKTVDRPTGSTWNVVVTKTTVLDPTTVQVELADAPSSVPDATRFTVRVDGTITSVSKVAQVGSNTRMYNLTIPSLMGKEGNLSVNDKAASIQGSDFGYDFKAPSVVDATGLTANTVKVIFSEKISAASANLTTNYELSKADGSLLPGATSKTPTSAELQSDGRTVILTTNGTMTNKNNDSKATVLATGADKAIQDIKGNRLAAKVDRTFTGAGQGQDNVAPRFQTAEYNEVNESLILTFDEPVKLQTSSLLTINNGSTSKNLGSFVGTVTDNKVVYKLPNSDIQKLLNGSTSLSVKILPDTATTSAVTDLYGNSTAAGGAVEKPVTWLATISLDSAFYENKDTDPNLSTSDTITVKFNKPVKKTNDFNATQFSLSPDNAVLSMLNPASDTFTELKFTVTQVTGTPADSYTITFTPSGSSLVSALNNAIAVGTTSTTMTKK